MNSKKVALVGMLVAVEVLIAGFAIWCIGGAGHLSAAGFGAHHIDYAAKTIATFEAGQTPHVVISDPESRVYVNVSSDGQVHVKDNTSIHGLIFSSDRSVPKLNATRTADGVLVQRADYNDNWMHVTFGNTEQNIEVDVPANSRVEIQKSSGATVAGLRAGISVQSQDGHIALSDVQGIVDAHSADGYIDANNVKGDTLTLVSADGHISMTGVTAQQLTARSNDGRVEATNLTIAGAQPQATLHSDDGSVHVHGSFAPGGTYEVSSNDGRVELALASNSDLTVTASTADGHISVDGQSSSSDGGDAHNKTIKLGSGSGSMRVSSGDGSIHLTTNGAF
jgi:DUF4097 and DUF4098 domain-containing protein YvlB